MVEIDERWECVWNDNSSGEGEDRKESRFF